MQIGMSQANALKSIGYAETVLFLTIGKLDINHHKNLGKSARIFYLGDQKLPKLAVDLPNLFCDRYPASQYPATVHLPHYQYSGIVLYPNTDFRCICKPHYYLHRK
jgi:hypothetical protein